MNRQEQTPDLQAEPYTIIRQEQTPPKVEPNTKIRQQQSPDLQAEPHSIINQEQTPLQAEPNNMNRQEQTPGPGCSKLTMSLVDV